MHGYLKRRTWPEPGSIPDVLDMFRSELRFYREIAPVIGARVPACYAAEKTADGMRLLPEERHATAAGGSVGVARIERPNAAGDRNA